MDGRGVQELKRDLNAIENKRNSYKGIVNHNTNDCKNEYKNKDNNRTVVYKYFARVTGIMKYGLDTPTVTIIVKTLWKTTL